MRICYSLFFIAVLAVGCQATSRSPDQHPDAARTVVEIRAMAYPDPSEGERPPQTFANTDLAECKTFERWLRSRRGWEPMEQLPANLPLATCAMIYGDGRNVAFALDDHALIRGNERLALSDEDYLFVRRMCLKR